MRRAISEDSAAFAQRPANPLRKFVDFCLIPVQALADGRKRLIEILETMDDLRGNQVRLNIYPLHFSANRSWCSLGEEALLLMVEDLEHALLVALTRRRRRKRINAGQAEQLTPRHWHPWPLGLETRSGVIFEDAEALPRLAGKAEMDDVAGTGRASPPCHEVCLPELIQATGCHLVDLDNILAEPAVQIEKPSITDAAGSNAGHGHAQVRQDMDLRGESSGSLAAIKAAEGVCQDRSAVGSNICDQRGHAKNLSMPVSGWDCGL